MSKEIQAQASTNSIWFQDHNHQWALFRPKNLSFSASLKELENLAMDGEIQKASADKDDDKLFYQTKRKIEIKGQTVYVPEGYGTIQKVNGENGTITVKGKNFLNEYQRKQVMYDIPIDLLMTESSVFRNERVLVSANSQAKDIVEKIEELLGSSKILNFTIFYKGKPFEKGPETCECLGIVPETKMCVCFSLGKIKIVNRYKNIYNGWGYSSTSVDGITFTASRALRVIGFGIYLPEHGKELEGKAKLYKGNSTSKEEYTLMKTFLLRANDTSYNPKIGQCLFDKAIDLPIGEQMSCFIEVHSNTSFYGSNGQATAVGEDDTIFTFHSCKCSTNGTSLSSGQIPEIYYI